MLKIKEYEQSEMILYTMDELVPEESLFRKIDKYIDFTFIYEEVKDLYCFRPAMAKLLYDIRQHYPNVEVYFILNSELKDVINESVKKICKTYQVPVIALHDIDKKNGHPTIKGMKSIAEQVLKVIKK